MDSGSSQSACAPAASAAFGHQLGGHRGSPHRAHFHSHHPGPVLPMASHASGLRPPKQGREAPETPGASLPCSWERLSSLCSGKAGISTFFPLGLQVRLCWLEGGVAEGGGRQSLTDASVTHSGPQHWPTNLRESYCLRRILPTKLAAHRKEACVGTDGNHDRPRFGGPTSPKLGFTEVCWPPPAPKPLSCGLGSPLSPAPEPFAHLLPQILTPNHPPRTPGFPPLDTSPTLRQLAPKMIY